MLKVERVQMAFTFTPVGAKKILLKNFNDEHLLSNFEVYKTQTGLDFHQEFDILPFPSREEGSISVRKQFQFKASCHAHLINEPIKLRRIAHMKKASMLKGESNSFDGSESMGILSSD